MNVRKALRHGAAMTHASRDASRDASLLLCRALGKDRSWLMAHPEECLSVAQAWQYEQWLARRAQCEPMQYILGEQEFYGLRLAVSPAVLIPRPETEHLVEAALALVSSGEPVRIADVGTGSGAIAVALACAQPLAQLTALDLSQAALQIARSNAEAHAVSDRVRFLESDLLAAVAGERFDIIVSNPPYVPSTEQLEPQVRDWEPHTALFAGEDGLAIYRRLIPQAREALVAGGWLLLEIGHGQRASVQALLEAWESVRFVADLQGIARVAVARKSQDHSARLAATSGA
ncbi:MAG TPA: peptide chain release factor N(5)-glutamine methyltransferase [Acidobacteriaceae bacterium]